MNSRGRGVCERGVMSSGGNKRMRECERRPQLASSLIFFFFQAEDGIRDVAVTGVQTCALPIYLFVPDNEHYEGSSRLLFDEQNHPVDSAKLTHEQQKAYDWRRCYKLVTLLHTNRAGEFFLYGGLRLTAGKDHEAPVLYELGDEVVECHGRGGMKRLIDRKRVV